MSNVELMGLIIIAMIPLSIVGAAIIKALGNRPGYRRRCQQPFEGVDRRCVERKTCEPEECPVAKSRNQANVD